MPSRWFSEPESPNVRWCNVCWAGKTKVKAEEKSALIKAGNKAEQVCCNEACGTKDATRNRNVPSRPRSKMCEPCWTYYERSNTIRTAGHVRKAVLMVRNQELRTGQQRMECYGCGASAARSTHAMADKPGRKLCAPCNRFRRRTRSKENYTWVAVKGLQMKTIAEVRKRGLVRAKAQGTTQPEEER